MIHQRSWIVATALTVILLWLASWWAITKIEADTQTEVGKSLTTLLETTRQGVKSWAKEHRVQVTARANSPEVVQLAEELLATERTREALINAPAQAEINDLLRPVYPERDYQGFFIIGPDNISLASSKDSNIGVPNLPLCP